jgi:hypothetical protein
MMLENGIEVTEVAGQQDIVLTVKDVILQLKELVEMQKLEIRELKADGERGRMYAIALEEIKDSLIEIVVGKDD